MPVGGRDASYVAQGRGQAVVDRGATGLLHVHEQEAVVVRDQHAVTLLIAAQASVPEIFSISAVVEIAGVRGR